jgi:glycerophosphoryl diester phosphodiesterase
MKIIGHRGAAGLAPENTIESIKTAIRTGVDAVEFDIRRTKDDVLVVSHDANLLRTYKLNMLIRNHTWAELHKACPSLPRFDDIVKASQKTPLVIELKEVIDPQLIKSVLNKHKPKQYSFVSFKSTALRQLQETFPQTPYSLLSFLKPMGRLKTARKIGMQGVGVHYATLNPFLYWQAKKDNIAVYTYTVNHRWLAWLITHLYPGVTVCTDRPDRLNSLRTK